MVGFEHIFNATDYDLMSETKQLLSEVEQDIRKAEQCKIDCEHRKQALAELKQRLELRMMTIFPNGRPQQ